MTLTNFRSGLSAELWVAHKFSERGYNVLWPLLTQSRYDLVVEKDGHFSKVQVKKATWSKSGNHRYLQSRLKPRDGRRYHPYRADEVDIFAFTDLTRLWLAPYADVGEIPSVCLTSSNPNYQSQTAYDAEAWLTE